MERLLDRFLRARSRQFLLALSVILIVLIGLVDYVTGYDLSLSLFYLAPVAILAWYDGGVTGYVAAITAALAWLIANSVGVPVRLTPTLLGWNTAIRLGFFIIVAKLLSSLRLAHEAQRRLARTDALTGAYNGRAFREVVQVELLRADRMGYPVSLIYLDFDNFKALNDRRGHEAGDALLQTFGREMIAGLRRTDMVGRLGGDEFAVLLPNTQPEQAVLVATKLKALVDRSNEGADPQVSLSIGVVTSADQVPEAEALISAGDRLMYEAKKAGKNQIRKGLLPSMP